MLSVNDQTLRVAAGGYSLIKTIALPKLLQSLSVNGQVIGISDAMGSNLQLHLADGS